MRTSTRQIVNNKRKFILIAVYFITSPKNRNKIRAVIIYGLSNKCGGRKKFETVAKTAESNTKQFPQQRGLHGGVMDARGLQERIRDSSIRNRDNCST